MTSPHIPPQQLASPNAARNGTVLSAFELKTFIDVTDLDVIQIGVLKAQLLWQLSGGAYVEELEKAVATNNNQRLSAAPGAFTIAAAAYKLNLKSSDVRQWMRTDELFAEAVQNAMDDFLDLVYSREAIRALELGGQAIDRVHSYRMLSQRHAEKVKVTFEQNADSNL